MPENQNPSVTSTVTDILNRNNARAAEVQYRNVTDSPIVSVRRTAHKLVGIPTVFQISGVPVNFRWFTPHSVIQAFPDPSAVAGAMDTQHQNFASSTEFTGLEKKVHWNDTEVGLGKTISLVDTDSSLPVNHMLVRLGSTQDKTALRGFEMSIVAWPINKGVNSVSPLEATQVLNVSQQVAGESCLLVIFTALDTSRGRRGFQRSVMRRSLEGGVENIGVAGIASAIPAGGEMELILATAQHPGTGSIINLMRMAGQGDPEAIQLLNVGASRYLNNGIEANPGAILTL